MLALSCSLKSGWSALVRPRVRLPLNASWSVSTMGRVYLMSLVAFVDGTLVPIVLFMLFMLWMKEVRWELFAAIVRLTFSADLQPTALFVTILSSVTFLTGFGSELLYIEYRMRKQGWSLTNSIGFHFDTIPGYGRYQKGWQILWRVAGAYGLWLLVERLILKVLPPPEQGTVDFVRELSGQPLAAVLMFVMAAVLAPIIEEIVFRGFLFNALRTSLRKGKTGELLRHSGTAADVMAVFVSSAVFALYHLQFQPTTLIMLFLLGALHAELYRRTGSLPVSIALHCLNNTIAMLMVLCGH